MSISKMNIKMHIKKGDTVMVLSGKERGKKGKVLRILPGKNRAIVEALNFSTRHQRPTQQNPQGGMLQIEAPIQASNLMVICAKCEKPTRVGRRILEDGSKVRVCKKCSEIMDLG